MSKGVGRGSEVLKSKPLATDGIPNAVFTVM